MAGIVKSRKVSRRFFSFWHVFIFISICTIILTSCENPKINEEYYSTLTPEQQKAELQRVLNKNIEDSQAHYLLGQLYQADKAWDEAEDQYNLAWRYSPAYWPAQAAMIKLCIDRGDPVKTQQYLDTYMNHAEDSPEKLVGLGLEFQNQNLDTYALDCLQKALKMVPTSAKAHNYLGYFYLSRNDKEKAREYFEESFKLNGNQADIAKELGLLDVPVEYEGPVPKGFAAEQ